MNILLMLVLKMAFAQSAFDGLQTGRYEIHKTAKTTQAKSTKKAKISVRTLAAEDSTDTLVNSAATSPLSSDSATLVKKEATEKVEPSITEQVQSLASGEAAQVYDFYREQVHPDDIRNNRVEIELSPGLVTNTSKSNYSYRDYQSTFHALKFSSNIWFTPLIGVSGRYIFSFAADVNGDTTTHSDVAASYEFIDLSVNLRRFFGLSRKASSAEFNLLYSDDKMKTASDNTSRGRLSSTGLGLGFKTRFPTTPNYAWVMGGSFFPWIQHNEAATGLALNSGSDNKSVKAGLDFGGEIKFTRESQIIWGLGMTIEKNLFNGSASLPDPATGATPESVSVTNTMLMFNLGYRWGQ